MTGDTDFAGELATQLNISGEAIEEATRRSLLNFVKHRNSRCWRFGDAANGCLRRIDGEPFKIRNQRVKAEAETRRKAWHRAIGMDDVVTNNRRDILLMLEGSKDGIAAFHFADAEGTLSDVGVRKLNYEQNKNQTTTAQRFLCARNCRRVIDVAQRRSPTDTRDRKHY